MLIKLQINFSINGIEDGSLRYVNTRLFKLNAVIFLNSNEYNF